MGLIRFLVIAFGIYLIFRLITRIILPLAARYFVKKASENMHEQMKRRMDGEKIYQDGKVEIRKSKASPQEGSASGAGEYVDFEEVKD